MDRNARLIPLRSLAVKSSAANSASAALSLNVERRDTTRARCRASFLGDKNAGEDGAVARLRFFPGVVVCIFAATVGLLYFFGFVNEPLLIPSAYFSAMMDKTCRTASRSFCGSLTQSLL